MNASPSEAHLNSAGQCVRDAVAAVRLWPSDWNAGSRALREIGAAIRELDAARIAFTHEIAVETDRLLAADPTPATSHSSASTTPDQANPMGAFGYG